MTNAILHQPIDVLGLPTVIVNSLKRQGCITVELLVALTPADIESMRNMGPTSRRHIERALAKHRLSLATPSSDAAPPEPEPKPPTPKHQREPRLKVQLTSTQIWDLQHLLRALCPCSGGPHAPDINHVLLHAILDALDDAAT